MVGDNEYHPDDCRRKNNDNNKYTEYDDLNTADIIDTSDTVNGKRKSKRLKKEINTYKPAEENMSDDYKMEEHDDSIGEDDSVQSINTETYKDRSDDENNQERDRYDRWEVIDINDDDNDTGSDNDEDSYDEKVGNNDDDSDYVPRQNENKSESEEENDDDDDDDDDEGIDENQKHITDYITRRNE